MAIRYIIRQSFCDNINYFLSMKRNVAEFVGQEKYAHEFKTKTDANQMITKIIHVSPSIGVLELVSINTSKKCNFDCFHCPYPDCVNGDAKRTDWEKQAIKIGRAGLNDDEE